MLRTRKFWAVVALATAGALVVYTLRGTQPVEAILEFKLTTLELRLPAEEQRPAERLSRHKLTDMNFELLLEGEADEVEPIATGTFRFRLGEAPPSVFSAPMGIPRGHYTLVLDLGFVRYDDSRTRRRLIRPLDVEEGGTMPINLSARKP